MDFKDHIKQLAERAGKLSAQLETEEAAKNALVMPFIQALGYDVFNPMEVVPEFVSDVGTKKGEKVDYAIKKDGESVILIECKGINDNLDKHDSQLIRYFHTTNAKFAILTNGRHYKFYSDLENTNKMDEKPFFVFDITDIKEPQILELKKFHKSYFDVDKISSTANELKYLNEIKNLLNEQYKSPSEDFVRFLIGEVYPGRARAHVVEQFKEITKKALSQWLNDNISIRLQSALEQETKVEKEEAEKTEEDSNENEKKIITTEEELEGFYIVKAILRQKIEGSRIVFKDNQSYFAINLDNNTRKPLCRLWLNGSKKYIGILDEQKNETKEEIFVLDDIYKYSDQLLKTIEYYN